MTIWCEDACAAMNRLSVLIPTIFFFLEMVSWAELKPIALKAAANQVQPMTGMVFWDSSRHRDTQAVQLEFSYVGYNEVATEEGEVDLRKVEEKLKAIAKRRHQAILRFYFVYPGKPTATPTFLRSLSDYRETEGLVEGHKTSLPDWTHPRLKQFVKEFHAKFAQRYDKDPRLAFVQVGFGSYAEYHLYQGPLNLGKTFPDVEFQADFLRHLQACYTETPWSISIDSAKPKLSPFRHQADLLKLDFGVFDDSFLCKDHHEVNERDWNELGRARYLRNPAGGELSYYTEEDQRLALSPEGPHGENFEKAAARFHLSYIIANDQPRYQSMARIQAAGAALGYRFRVIKFLSGEGRSKVVIRNEGIAPIYRDAFVSVNGKRSRVSLKGLAPQEQRSFEIQAGGEAPQLRIESDHLVPGQAITYDADLKGNSR